MKSQQKAIKSLPPLEVTDIGPSYAQWTLEHNLFQGLATLLWSHMQLFYSFTEAPCDFEK